MSDAMNSGDINIADKTFWDEVNWTKVSFNKISKEEFLKAFYFENKLFATFLGNQEQLQFFMYRPISWPIYKEIKSKKLSKDSTHEHILSSCIVWPKMDVLELNSLDAGIVLTLVYQVLAVSNFLKEPEKALEMILEIK